MARIRLLAKIDETPTAATLDTLGISRVLADAGVKTGAYTVAANEYVRADTTAGAFALLLPTAPVIGTRILIKKILTSYNALTVNCGGSDVFNESGGSTSISLIGRKASVSLQYIATGIWSIATTDPGLDITFEVFGTASALATTNATYPANYRITETDSRRSKLGDGATAYNSLLYADNMLFNLLAADQAITNSTTQTNSALSLALEANTTYTYEALLVYDGSTTGDFRTSFAWPTGATGWYCADSALVPAGTAMTTLFSGVTGGTLAIGALGVASKQLIRIDGLIKTTSAGTLQHRFSQNTIDAVNASTLYTNSYLAARRRP